jgi:Alpha-2,8-polysialyltransferase (POLYST)
VSQLFLASTSFGAMNLAAAIDDGIFESVWGSNDRVLLVSTNSTVPEATPPLSSMPGFEAVARRFDRVVDWNAVLAPFAPSDFKAFGEPSVVSRWLQSHLGLDDLPVELILESIQVHPARGLADLFVTAPVTMYSDGLMSYGPTRVGLPDSLGARIDRLVYLDLLPGVEPRLLREFDVEPVPISDSSFRRVLAETSDLAPQAAATARMLTRKSATALVLGQYLGALGIVSRDEELEIYTSIAAAAAAAGHQVVAYKPHPTAPPVLGEITSRAAELGVEVIEIPGSISVEHVLHHWRPDLVAGCFSTGLLVADRYFGLDIAAGGTELVLDRLDPYPNSNRVPLTVIDAVVPRVDTGAAGGIREPRIDLRKAPAVVQALIDVTAFQMQPKLHGRFRDDVVEQVRRLDPNLQGRYIDDELGAKYGLPGAPVRLRRRVKLRVYEATAALARPARRNAYVAQAYRRARAFVAPPIKRVVRKVPPLRRIVRVLER